MDADEDERTRREEQRISRHTFGAIGGPRFTGQRPPPPSYQPPSLHGKHPTGNHITSTTSLYPTPQSSYPQRRPSTESARPPGASASASTDPSPSTTPVSQSSPSSTSNSSSVSMTLNLPTTTPSGSQRSSPRSPGRSSHTEQHIKASSTSGAIGDIEIAGLALQHADAAHAARSARELLPELEAGSPLGAGASSAAEAVRAAFRTVLALLKRLLGENPVSVETTTMFTDSVVQLQRVARSLATGGLPPRLDSMTSTPTGSFAKPIANPAPVSAAPTAPTTAPISGNRPLASATATSSLVTIPPTSTYTAPARPLIPQMDTTAPQANAPPAAPSPTGVAKMQVVQPAPMRSAPILDSTVTKQPVPLGSTPPKTPAYINNYEPLGPATHQPSSPSAAVYAPAPAPAPAPAMPTQARLAAPSVPPLPSASLFLGSPFAGAGAQQSPTSNSSSMGSTSSSMHNTPPTSAPVQNQNAEYQEMPRPSSASSSSVSSVGSDEHSRPTSGGQAPLSDVRLATAKHPYTPSDTQVDHLATRGGDIVEVVEAGGNGWWYVRRQRDGQKGFVPASFFLEGVPNANAALRKQQMPNRPPPPTPMSPRGARPLELDLSRTHAGSGGSGGSRRSHELVDAKVDEILNNFATKALGPQGPASPRSGSSGSPLLPSPSLDSDRDRQNSTASRRQQKLNVLDDLLEKMDTLGPLQPPSAFTPERKAEKLTISVRWPDEISGAEAYSRLVAPDLNDSVRVFIGRLLNMPVSRSRGPYNLDEWGLWSETRWSFVSDEQLLSTLELTPKEGFALKRRRHVTSSMAINTNGTASQSPSSVSVAAGVAATAPNGSSSSSSAPSSPAMPSHPPPSEDPSRATTVYTGAPPLGPQPDFGAEATGGQTGAKGGSGTKLLELSVVSKEFSDYEALKRQMASPSPVLGASPSPTEADGSPAAARAEAPRKPTSIVHWPEEMAGADYQKLMAIEPSTVVAQLMEKMLIAPVAKAKGPWNPADWALWVERFGFLDDTRTMTFYELSQKDELFLVRKGNKRPENKRSQTKVEAPGSDINLPKPFQNLLVRTKSERTPSRADDVLAISSPLTMKTAQSFGVSYEPAAQPMRLPDDLARAKAEHDRAQQRKTVATPPGSAISPNPSGDQINQSNNKIARGDYGDLITPSRVLLMVHWPSELAGVDDYSKLMAPDLSETCSALIKKIFASPVTTITAAGGNQAEWGLFCERLDRWLDDDRPLSHYDLREKDDVFMRRKPEGLGMSWQTMLQMPAAPAPQPPVPEKNPVSPPRSPRRLGGSKSMREIPTIKVDKKEKKDRKDKEKKEKKDKGKSKREGESATTMSMRERAASPIRQMVDRATSPFRRPVSPRGPGMASPPRGAAPASPPRQPTAKTLDSPTRLLTAEEQRQKLVDEEEARQREAAWRRASRKVTEMYKQRDAVGATGGDEAPISEEEIYVLRQQEMTRQQQEERQRDDDRLRREERSERRVVHSSNSEEISASLYAAGKAAVAEERILELLQRTEPSPESLPMSPLAAAMSRLEPTFSPEMFATNSSPPRRASTDNRPPPQVVVSVAPVAAPRSGSPFSGARSTSNRDSPMREPSISPAFALNANNTAPSVAFDNAAMRAPSPSPLGGSATGNPLVSQAVMSAAMAAATDRTTGDLRTRWHRLILSTNVPEPFAGEYAKNFADNEIELAQANELTAEILQSMGVRLGHVMRIIRSLNSSRNTNSGV